MSRPENNVPGCAHDSWGRCLVNSGEASLAYLSFFVPLSEIEGPGLETEKGFGCNAATDLLKQRTCSKFEQRTSEHNQRDNNQ